MTEICIRVEYGDADVGSYPLITKVKLEGSAYFKVHGKGIMIVEIGVKPTRINKANSYRWFTDEHFSVSTGISSY